MELSETHTFSQKHCIASVADHRFLQQKHNSVYCTS